MDNYSLEDIPPFTPAEVSALGRSIAIDEKPRVIVERSASITKLAQSLVLFQSEVEAIKKDAENPFFKSKYAPLESIIAGIREPLKKAGLAVTQWPVGEDRLTTILVHESGEYLSGTAKMSPKDHTPQGQGSAITYMRRYSLGAVLNLATEEDDDGNEASKPQAAGNGNGKPPTNPAPQTPQKFQQTEAHKKLWDTLFDFYGKNKEATETALFNLTTYTSKSGQHVKGHRVLGEISEQVAQYAFAQFIKEHTSKEAK